MKAKTRTKMVTTPEPSHFQCNGCTVTVTLREAKDGRIGLVVEGDDDIGYVRGWRRVDRQEARRAYAAVRDGVTHKALEAAGFEPTH